MIIRYGRRRQRWIVETLPLTGLGQERDQHQREALLPDDTQAGTNEGVEIKNTGPKILTLEDGAYILESQPEKSNRAPAISDQAALNGGV
jgi:hypothetical protein